MNKVAQCKQLSLPSWRSTKCATDDVSRNEGAVLGRSGDLVKTRGERIPGFQDKRGHVSDSISLAFHGV